MYLCHQREMYECTQILLQDSFTLRGLLAGGRYVCDLYSLVGQKVLSSVVRAGDTMDTSTLSSGQYILILQAEGRGAYAYSSISSKIKIRLFYEHLSEVGAIMVFCALALALARYCQKP